MAEPNFIILYVANPPASGEFYGKILGRGPVEASPGFVLFALGNGTMLGLWARQGVAPAPETPAGSGELAFAVADAAAVQALHAEWLTLAVRIIQPPQLADFGENFLATDPDGNRLRVFAAPQG